MKILGQVIAVQPLVLIVSLPNQLLGHIPITQISSQLTAALESMGEEDELESGMESEAEDGPSGRHQSRVPELFEVFHPGQFVRCAVTAVRAPGTTDSTGTGLKAREGFEKASRRVELSIAPHVVNAGVVKSDLKPGFVSVHWCKLSLLDRI
jgi:rRNA biogenesis protein RRP5